MSKSIYQLCQPSTGQEDDWKNLYLTAFPKADDRMPVEDIRQLLGKGQMALHKTTNQAGDLLCFSLFFPVTDFGLLSYIATDPTKQSTGVGSKHLRQLLRLMKAQYPNHTGVFLEAESPREAKLDAASLKVRRRRLAFYLKLGALRLCRNYLLPSLVAGNSSSAGELLWFDFGVRKVDGVLLERVVIEIYDKAYGLKRTDPVVAQVLADFASRTTPVVCTVPTADNHNHAVAAPPAPPTGSPTGNPTGSPTGSPTSNPTGSLTSVPVPSGPAPAPATPAVTK